jgi:cell division transport system permease protein
VRLRFVLSEMAIGLRRNLSMTIAVVLTVAISLTGLGGAWLVHKQVNTMKDYWFDKIQVSVFLTKTVSQPERTAIRDELAQLPQVQHVYYESKEQAYERFKVQFKDVPSLVKNTSPDALPESYRVKLKDPQKYQIVASAVQNMPGVDEVQGRSKALENFFRFLNGLQRIVLFGAALALLATILLIFNTVRLAAFSRRRETGIMRLVGASDLYIQAPFVLEGAFAGFVGACIAVLGLIGFKAVMIDHGVKQVFGNIVRYIGWGVVLQTIPVVLVIGVLLAAVTSMVTLQRYLRV